MQDIFDSMGLIPDFTYTDNNKIKLNYIHRGDDKCDIYFIANQNENIVKTLCKFRITNSEPELWYAEDGKIKKAFVYKQLGETTEIPIELGPYESVFVIFQPSENREHIISVTKENKLVDNKYSIEDANGIRLFSDKAGKYRLKNSIGKEAIVVIDKDAFSIPIKQPWKVVFPSGWNIPDTVRFSELSDWAENSIEGIKYFSGSAKYINEINVPLKAIEKGNKVELDFGEVKNIATVIINGKEIITLWKPPFKIDVTDILCPDKNTIEVIVTNTWVNRLVGDEQFAADVKYEVDGQKDLINAVLTEFPVWLNGKNKRLSERKTFVTYQYYNKSSKLEPSGLLGPVELIITGSKIIKF